MQKGILITIGSLAAFGVGYVIYKKQVPPRFTVREFSPATMQGYFEWGNAHGQMMNSSATFVAGWGWDVKFIPDSTNKTVTVNIFKNGKPYNSFTVDHTGVFKV